MNDRSSLAAPGKDGSQFLETVLFFKGWGAWVLFGLLAVAVWFRFMPLVGVCVFLLLLFFLVNQWKRLSLKGVKPDLSLSRSRVFAGEDFPLQVSVHNDKWLPLVWLEWVFPLLEGISFGEEGEPVSVVRFLWLSRRQKAGWSLKGQACRRGVYDLGRTVLRSGDGFRFSETEKAYELKTRLWVYPERIPVRAPAFSPSLQWGAKGGRGGFIEDPLMISGIREYQAGDEWRKINWRASARTGRLQTNMCQPVVLKQLVFCVDVRGFEPREGVFKEAKEQELYEKQQREVFETFLSVVASAALDYGRKGVSVGFACNGLNREGAWIKGVMPAADLTPVLDQLAELTWTEGIGPWMGPLEELLTRGRLSCPVFVFCRRFERGHDRWSRQSAGKVPEVRFYYQEETEWSAGASCPVKPLESLRLAGDSNEGRGR